MKKLAWLTLVSMIAVLLAACGNDENTEAEADTGGNEDWPETLRFGAADIEGMEQLHTEFEPFRAELEDALDMEVEFFALSNRTTAVTAMEYDQVDLLFAGGAEYVMMDSADENTEPIAALTRPGYLPVIISHEDSGIETIEDMEGASIALSDIGSTSAYIMPMKMFNDAGYDVENDIEAYTLGDTMYEAFLTGETDTLALTALNYEDLVEEEGDIFNVVAEGPALPNDLIVASPHLPEDLVEFLEEKMIENGDVLIDAIVSTGENDKFSESEFINAEDSDYDGLRDAYELLGLDFE